MLSDYGWSTASAQVSADRYACRLDAGQYVQHPESDILGASQSGGTKMVPLVSQSWRRGGGESAQVCRPTRGDRSATGCVSAQLPPRAPGHLRMTLVVRSQGKAEGRAAVISGARPPARA